jgi:hypothetical protein
VVESDIEACNGIIHIIDKVILPENIEVWVPGTVSKEPTAAPIDVDNEEEQPTEAPTDTEDDQEDVEQPTTCQTIGTYLKEREKTKTTRST